MGRRDKKAMVDENDPQWCRFWNAFPRRCAKKDARVAWAQLAPTAQQVDLMVAALAWQMTSEQWTRDGGRYIPYPASYLRGRRFEDEPPMNVSSPMSDAAAMVFQTLGVKP